VTWHEDDIAQELEKHHAVDKERQGAVEGEVLAAALGALKAESSPPLFLARQSSNSTPLPLAYSPPCEVAGDKPVSRCQQAQL
jgi:hypothetical protein